MRILTKKEIVSIEQEVKETLPNVSLRQITDGSVSSKLGALGEVEETVLEVSTGEEKRWVFIHPSSASQEFIVRKINTRLTSKNHSC